MKQLKLFRDQQDIEFGGSKNKGKRKAIRPIHSKRPLHLVLKATNGCLLLRNQQFVERTFRQYSNKFGLKIYGLAVHADHIHLNLKVPHREKYKKWIRAVSSRLVSGVVGLKWALRPYSRILTWGRQFRRTQNYIDFNRREADFIYGTHNYVENWLRSLNTG